jgi:molecular chaperone Hsp33
MDELPAPPEISLEIRSYFVRERNALLTRAEFSDLFVDYYLHMADLHVQAAPEHDRLFKEALIALTLHCAARPWNETIAWTLNFQNPLLNIFVHGSNPLGTVVGRFFQENVRINDHNFFFADIARKNQLPHRSSIQFEGSSAFLAAETYYRQSEQRTARYFELAEEEYVFISAQPDCDTQWLESLTVENVQTLEQDEEMSLLESRPYRWSCGCDQDRMMSVLEPSMKSNANTLFGGEASLRMSCPRCGQKYIITREALEAFIKKK